MVFTVLTGGEEAKALIRVRRLLLFIYPTDSFKMNIILNGIWSGKTNINFMPHKLLIIESLINHISGKTKPSYMVKHFQIDVEKRLILSIFIVWRA